MNPLHRDNSNDQEQLQQWLRDADVQDLGAAYALYWSVQSAARLVSGKGAGEAIKGEGGAAFLLRSAQEPTLRALESALAQAYDTAARRIDAAVGPVRKKDEEDA